MDRRIHFYLAAGCFMVGIHSPVSAQDAEPAKMMAPPYFAQAQNQSNDFKVIDPQSFSKLYKQAKEPTVMVFMGRSFSSFVSDWHANTKLQINTEIKSESKDLPKTISTEASIQNRQYVGQGRSSLHTAEEWDAIELGFRETLLAYRVKILQQNLATRLLDAELRQSGNKLAHDDQQRLEMDVLRKHSKLLIEITPYLESRQLMQKVGYQISVSSLASATIVAEKRIGLPLPAAEYRAGAQGYELQEVPVRTDYKVGEKGYEAVRTYEDLSYKNGKSIALALIDVLAQSGLAGID